MPSEDGKKLTPVVEYTFQLRPGFWVKVKLPEDFNAADVNRMARWLAVLPTRNGQEPERS